MDTISTVTGSESGIPSSSRFILIMDGSQYMPKHSPSRNLSFLKTFLLVSIAVSSADERSTVMARSIILSWRAEGANSPGARLRKMEIGVSSLSL